MTEPTNNAVKPSAWSKTKTGGKTVFDKGWAAFEKLGGPVNKLTNKIGSEAFWPTGMEKECEKAARILKSFCSTSPQHTLNCEQPTNHLIEDGFMAEQQKDASLDSETKKKVQDGPSKPPKVLVKIPQKVIKNCVGLAIYTTMRSGLWVSGAGGSGVLIAKNESGQWSPPSGILIHTLGVGFMAGIDIYDCVIVINDRKALDAFSKLRVSLGGEISVVAGPIGSGGILEGELLKNSGKPLFSYMKSRGLYAGAQVDGTIIIERNDENARYYGEKLSVAQIIQGHVPSLPPTAELLMEVAKDAEGRPNLNQSVLQQVYDKPTPADVEIVHSGEASEDEKKKFGNPNTAEGYAAQQQFHGYQQQQQGYSQGNDQFYPPPPSGAPPHPDHNPLAQNPPAYYPPPSDFPQQQTSSATETDHGYYAPEKPPRPT